MMMPKEHMTQIAKSNRKLTMSKEKIFHYSDSCTIVKCTKMFYGAASSGRQDKRLIFKNCVPPIDCIREE